LEECRSETRTENRTETLQHQPQERAQVGGLSAKDGWVNMQVQFLIDQKTANSDKMLVGWTVLRPALSTTAPAFQLR